MDYAAWRISYQSDEQAARAAYAEVERLRQKLTEMDGKLAKKPCTYGRCETHNRLVAQIEESAYDRDEWRLVPVQASDAQLNAAVEFAVNVRLGGRYRWKDYMRDLYGRFLATAPEKEGTRCDRLPIL